MTQMGPSLTLDLDPGSYPQNVADHILAPYALDTIRQRLDKQAPRLFTDEAGAALDFLDLESGAGGMLNYLSFSRGAQP